MYRRVYSPKIGNGHGENPQEFFVEDGRRSGIEKYRPSIFEAGAGWTEHRAHEWNVDRISFRGSKIGWMSLRDRSPREVDQARYAHNHETIGHNRPTIGRLKGNTGFSNLCPAGLKERKVSESIYGCLLRWNGEKIIQPSKGHVDESITGTVLHQAPGPLSDYFGWTQGKLIRKFMHHASWSGRWHRFMAAQLGWRK
jgi:hypothetical protein